MEIREQFLPYALPCTDQTEIDAIADTLRSNWLSRGPKTARFEEEFATYTGAKYAVAMNSCTAALHIALLAAGIGPGDEVITTAMTFCASANTIIHAGARPVLVDIDPVTHCISPAAVEAAITPRTKAIVPVHYGGHACDMDAIHAIAKRHNLFVLEDAAHAVYTQYKGKMIGGLSGATAFSFYANKNLSTGEGGMLTTNDEKLAACARQLSLHGMSRNAWNRFGKGGSWYYEVDFPGYKYNMTDIQAAMGLVQLSKLEGMQAVRQQYAEAYNKLFAVNDAIITPVTMPYTRHAWHIYAIWLKKGAFLIDRAKFIEELSVYNIGTSVHYIPVHMHPYYVKTFGYKPEDFPQALAMYEGIISLPLYPGMSAADIEYTAAAVLEIADKYKA